MGVAGTVGRAQGTVKVTILDEKNQELPTGKIGEVCIRGPNVTTGYINRPEANEEAFAGSCQPPCSWRMQPPCTCMSSLPRLGQAKCHCLPFC